MRPSGRFRADIRATRRGAMRPERPCRHHTPEAAAQFAHDVVPQGSGDVDAVNEQDGRTGTGVGVGDINTVDADLLSRHWCTLNRFGPQVHMFHVTLTRRA